MIQLNRTTIWKDFSQYVPKYKALKICPLKYFEQCIYLQAHLLTCLRRIVTYLK